MKNVYVPAHHKVELLHLGGEPQVDLQTTEPMFSFNCLRPGSQRGQGRSGFRQVVRSSSDEVLPSSHSQFPESSINIQESEPVTDIVEGKVGNLASGDAGSEVGDVPNQPDLLAVDLHHLLDRFKFWVPRNHLRAREFNIVLCSLILNQVGGEQVIVDLPAIYPSWEQR